MQFKHKIYNLQALSFLRSARFRIGLLGGSFNPAHMGHFALSIEALKKYKFDYIIWLVAKQNPFKASYAEDIFTRANNACKIAQHPKIIISTAESEINSNQTYYVIKNLKTKFSNVEFCWLMGVDNIVHFKKWERNEEIRKLCDIIIFDRPCNERMLSLGALYTENKKAKFMKVSRAKLLDISSTNLRKKTKY